MKYKLSRNLVGAIALGSLITLAPKFAAAVSNYDSNHERIEVAFVLDTTGSMSALIDGAKKKIWSIANTIVDINPDADIRMALVAYRDYGDDYVVKTFDMSSDIQGLYSDLLSFRANGGGDTPEAVNEALDATLQDINWTQRPAKQIMFLVGDAPPHMDYKNNPKYPQILREARQQGIVVHAVQAGSAYTTRKYWKHIANLGGGSYIAIPQDGGQLTHIDTPYDDEIIELQRRLDETVIPYGHRKQRAELRSKLKEKAAAPKSSAVDNAKFYSKRSKKEIVTGGGNILADIDNRAVTLESIAPNTLPDELKDLSKSEQKAYIEKKIKTRKTLEKQMADLVSKHDDYVKSQVKKPNKKNSFDEAVSKALTKSF